MVDLLLLARKSPKFSNDHVHVCANTEFVFCDTDKTHILGLSLDGITGLPAKSIQKLSHLRYIQIRKGLFNHLEPGTFAHMPELRLIDISSSALATVAEDAFINLPKLDTVILTDNQLKKIPNFSEIPSLKVLYLDGNAIAEIKEGTFAGLPFLEEVRIDGSFSTIDSHLCDSPALTKLGLVSSEALTLDAQPFKHCTQQVFIEITASSLSSTAKDGIHGKFGGLALFLKELQLGDAPFRTMSSLLDLSLSIENPIPLDRYFFDGLSSLTSLHISGPRQQTLPADLFVPMQKLTGIQIEFMDLNWLPTQIFPPLLKFLLIRNSPGLSLSSDWFQDPSSLEFLRLERLSLRALPKNFFQKFSHLIWLSLAHNELESLSSDFLSEIQKVTHLDLSYNRFVVFPNVFATKNEISELLIAGNFIRTIDDAFFEHMGPQLTKLDLSENLLSSLPQDLNLPKLTSLKLSKNYLLSWKIPPWLCKTDPEIFKTQVDHTACKN